MGIATVPAHLSLLWLFKPFWDCSSFLLRAVFPGRVGRVSWGQHGGSLFLGQPVPGVLTVPFPVPTGSSSSTTTPT